MSRRPAIFRRSDLVRAIRSVEAAGKEVAVIEIGGDGKIRIVVGTPNKQDSGQTPLDVWIAKHARAP
jgi:hypothetical protein